MSDKPELEAERNFLVSEMKKIARDAKTAPKMTFANEPNGAKCN